MPPSSPPDAAHLLQIGLSLVDGARCRDQRAHAEAAHRVVLARLVISAALPTPAPLRGVLWEAARALEAADPVALDALDAALAPWRVGRTPLEAASALHPRLLGQRRVEEAGRSKAARRAAGVFYTPGGTARWLVDQTLGPLEMGPNPLQIADPCCGCGAFLLAAIDHLLARAATPAPDTDPLHAETFKAETFEAETFEAETFEAETFEAKTFEAKAFKAETFEAEFHGVDLDPVAVEIARLRVAQALTPALGRDEAVRRAAAHIQIGEGLSAPLPALDAVLSNPPFGNAIGGDTSRDKATRERHQRLLPEIAVGAYDLSTLFVARAVERLKPGGRYGLVVPRSALSIASARALRGFVNAEAPLQTLWSPSAPRIFHGADVFVALLCGQRGAPPQAIQINTSRPDEGGAPSSPMDRIEGAGLPGSGSPDAGSPEPWMPLLLPERALLQRVASAPIPRATLGHLCDIHGGAATGAAYDLRPLVVDAAEAPGPRLITTGLIERYESLWGQTPCRFLGGLFDHPRWPAPAPVASVSRAMARQASPKVLVGGLTRVLEAVADPDGALAGVVSTWVVKPRHPDRRCLWLLEALLNAPLLSLIYMTRFRGKELSGGNTTVGRRELASLEAPGDLWELIQIHPKPSIEALMAPDSVFALDPLDPRDRALLALQAVQAVQRQAGEPLDANRDALASACVARLYGLDRRSHEAALVWFRARSRIVINPMEEP